MDGEKSSDQLKRYQRRQRGAAILSGEQDAFRKDGYTNMLNKYGTQQDNSEAYSFVAEEAVNDMELERLYEGNGLFTKIIDRPAEEAVKHGFDIDFGDDDISEYVEDKMDALQVEDHFATAEKWARLYGGAIIVMLADDGRGLEEPLDWENVRSIDELRVFERPIVQPDYTSMYNFNFEDTIGSTRPLGQPEYYDVFSIYGSFRVHYSRCLIFRNGRMPEHTSSAMYRYWGIPEYVKIKRALRETITSHTDGVKLLERSVQAIYKMKNLANMLATDKGEDDVIKRMQVIDMARGILNSLAIDADGEDYDFKTLQMSGVKDILDSTCNMLSAVTDIPQTILFGRSPAGENSTGDSDMENYYNMVERIQKMNMKSNGRTLIDLMLKEGKHQSKISIIPRYKVKFAPLWSMSETEQASVEQIKAQTELTKAQTTEAYVNMQAIDPTEVRRGLSQNEEYAIQDLVPEDELNIQGEAIAIEGISSAKEPALDGEVQAAAVIVVRSGKILAGQRADNEGLCGPGGKVEQGEDAEEAANREAYEEFCINTRSLFPIGKYEPSSRDYKDTKIFLCIDFDGEPRPDGEELLSAEWYSIEQLFMEPLFPPFRQSLELLLNELEEGAFI